MQSIYDFVGRELKWVQPHARKMEYELNAGTELVANLRFRSAFGSLATAESADGCWTFKRVGFWATRATIRACGSDQELAAFRNNTWKSGGTLELPNGRRYPASSNLWATAYAFTTEAGEPLVKFHQIGGTFHLSTLVDILPAAAFIAELPWLVTLGWYLAVMQQMDSAAVIAAVTVTG